MLSKNNFFKDISTSLKKTKQVFKVLAKEIENHDIPVLQSYNRDYELNFSPSIIKKFSKFNNVIIIGMGGSILGTKSIYSYFKNNIKKKNIFF